MYTPLTPQQRAQVARTAPRYTAAQLAAASGLPVHVVAHALHGGVRLPRRVRQQVARGLHTLQTAN